MKEKLSIGISTLHLTAHCLDLLIESLLKQLADRHPGILSERVSQIYGFGSFLEDKPSLKLELENFAGTFVNGKYLYDKKRELQSGKPFIKINKPYNVILFEYLGYENVQAFIEDKIKDATEKSKQLELLHSDAKQENLYYVSYHFGEYKAIVKAQVTVRDNWKRVEYNYIYPQADGSFKAFLYYGDIKKRNDTLHIQTRTFLDGKMVPSGENILYVGYGDPAKSQFILGVFSAFDINNKLIAVKTIHERCASKEEMEKRSLDKKIPGYIAQELRNKRIENDILIPNDKMELSPESPYYLTYEKIAGTYTFEFEMPDATSPLFVISVDPDNYKISSGIEGVLINNDEIHLLHNASVLNIRLKLSGLTPFLQLDIYMKTYYLKGETPSARGKYCGIDFENRLVSGAVSFTFTAAENTP